MNPRVSVRLLRLDTDVRGAEQTGLADEDLAAASNIGNAERRRRFLASRRAVRALLAQNIGCPPEQVPIRRARDGKPALVGNDLQFSVSRRNGYCAVATCPVYPIGVDVELIPPLPVFRTVLDGFFPAQARDAVLRAPRRSRPREFALWWCRMESSVKACGSGLDDAATCLAITRQQATAIGGELAVAVAAATSEPFDVEWVFG